MTSSIGMMNFPIYGKSKNVSKHQSDIISLDEIFYYQPSSYGGTPFMETTKWFIMVLGKLHYFTNLNCWAIKGDDSPYIHHHLWVSVVGWGRDQIYADGRCPYANHGPHGPGIWIATFTPFLWPSFVGEFPSTMEHGGWGVWMRSEKSGWSRVKSWQNLWRNFVVF